MAKADGQVLISLDIDDNTKAPIEKAESRLKQLGKGAGDELDSSMKSNANKAEETAKKSSNVIDGDFKKPVSKKLDIKADEAKKELKYIDESTAKLVKGENNIKFKVSGDATGKIKDIFEDEKKIPKEQSTNLKVSGNAKEKISDTAKAAKSAGNGFSHLHDIIMGTFIGGAIQSGLFAITSGLKNMLSEGLEYGKVQQKMLATWTTLTGSAAKGQGMVDVTNKLSVALGQDTDVVDELDQQFYHVFDNKEKTEQLTKSVLTMGDAIGMSGDDVKRLGLNFTHMMAGTKMQLGDFNMISDQLPMFGENLLKYEQKVQKNTNLTMSELRNQMSAGKISAEDAENVMNNLGKKYSKASDNLMGTLIGMGRVVKSRVPALVSDMTKPFLNAENPVLGMLSKWVQSNKADEMMKGLGENIKVAMDTVIGAFNPKFSTNSFNKNMQNFISGLGAKIIAFGDDIAAHKKDIENFFSILKQGGQITGKLTIAYLKALLPVVQMFGDFAAKHPKLFGFLITGFVDLSIASKLLSKPIGMIMSLNGVLGKLGKKVADNGGLKGISSSIKGIASGLTGKTVSNSKVVNTIGKNAMTEGGAAGKLATGAAGAGVAVSAGLDIYKAFKAKNPESKFKNAGKGLGTAIGGGLGLFFGGPLGAALGATIGKVIGGWGGKGAKLFTDGWNKKGKGAKPPKGFLPKAGYYARAGGDAIVGWGKGFARGVGKAIKNISDFNKKVGRAFGKVVKVIQSVLKPIKKVLELALVIPIALVVGLAIKAWSKMKKPFKAVIDFILKVVKSGWKIIKSITKSTWRAFEKHVINPVKAVWRVIDKYIVKTIVKAIRSAWKGIKSLTKSTWNAFKRYIVNPIKAVWSAARKYIVKLIVNNIKSAWKDIKSITKSAWNLIKKYAVDPIVSVYDKVKSIMGKMKKVISSAMGSIKKVWHSAWSNVGDFFTRIWKSIKNHAEDGINGVIKVINAGISGIDGVIHAFGGKKHAIGRIGKVHFATGTGSLTSNFRRSIDRMTPAVVNDRPGASNPELIYRHATGNVEWMKGRNAETMLMPGDEVANDRDSALLAPTLGIQHFAKGGIGNIFGGIGSFVKGAISGAVSTVSKGAQWLKNLFTTATKIIGHPVKSLEELLKYKRSGKGIFKSLGKNMFGVVKDKAADWWKSLWSMVDLNGSGITGGVAHTPGAGWKVTSGFGGRGAVSGGYSSHDGVDFSGASLVRAMLPGIVSGYGGAPSGWGGSNGIGEYIATHGLYNAIYQELNGKSNSGAKILVKKGETVKAGDPIAELGPNASHVHVGVTKHPMFSIGGSGTAGWLDVTKLKSAGKSDKKSKGSNNTIRKQVGGGFWKLISKIAGLFGDASGSGDNTVQPSGSHKDWLKEAGITSNFDKWNYIINHESGWNPKATNGGSGAYGLPQSLPGSKMASAGSDWRSNPITQLKWMKSYVSSRYGGIGNAYRYWLSHHNYANGGIVNGLTRAILGEDPLHPIEHVINTGKPSSDGLLADAISTRAKNNPSGVYAQMQSLITSAHNSQRMFGTQLQTGSSLQDTVSNGKLLKQMAADMHTTAQKDINGDVYLGTNKVGSILEQRKNKKDFNSQFFAGQLKNQGGLTNA